MNALVPRQNPLDISTLEKLEDHVKKHFVFKEKKQETRRPIADDNGTVYRWEFDVVTVGTEVFLHGEPDPKLLDAVNRPATKPLILAHLSKLSAHKRYTQGETGLAVVMADIAEHLDGCSEYALVKVLRDLQLDESPFWPETGTIVHRVKDLSDQLQWAARGQEPPKKPEKPKEEPFVKPELAHRRKVISITAALLSGKKLEELPEEDQAFWKEVRSKA